MTAIKDDGGPFHPYQYTHIKGVTFREVAAMHMMAAQLVVPNLSSYEPNVIAEAAVEYADALIAELKK